MKLSGTPGQTRVIPVDPNNQRIALDSPNGSDVAGVYNQVTVDITGRVVSGKFITNPAPTPIPVNPVVVEGDSQILLYISDPNVEGVVPADQNKPAMCYSLDTAMNLMMWNTLTKTWQ